MPDPRFAGIYTPGLVQMIIGAPVGPGGIAIVIPNLPAGATFPILITGRANDNFLTATQTTDSEAYNVGADGEVVAVRSFDKTGMFTFTVMASSINNLVFSAAHAALNNPIAPLDFRFPVQATDPASIGDIVTGANCGIQRAPDYVKGAAEGNNAWVFLASDIRIQHGARIF